MKLFNVFSVWKKNMREWLNNNNYNKIKNNGLQLTC